MRAARAMPIAPYRPTLASATPGMPADSVGSGPTVRR